MLKFKLKYFNLIILLLFFATIIFNVSYANDGNSIVDYFANPTPQELDTMKMRDVLFTILQTLGFALAIIITLITAIKFLIATPQQKAALKDKLWLIVVGIIILAGGIPLLQLIVNVLWGARDKI